MRRGERHPCRMFATVPSTWICPEILQYNLRLIGVSIRRVIVTQLEQLIRSFSTIFREMQKLERGGRQTLERAVSTVVVGTMDNPPLPPNLLPTVVISAVCLFLITQRFGVSLEKDLQTITARNFLVLPRNYLFCFPSEQKFSLRNQYSFLAKYKRFN